ncbi:hypothetical protein BCF33_2389 [Hasllibacter halocynthiae]|uniref:4Fe-4S ferredoxin-type domain-containing protein n=1 Tax=Hasllibacter halocynthiae TaxID=595589 RepID=A0A2T0X3K1_9RHOB|nr:ferredoxin [Hasllibacter halocynthiae]PRY93518.1 hypothetical protein BCF33_2389 [Hasllibacter halocynthiae]
MADAPEGLRVLGGFRKGGRTILILAPAEPRFWAVFTASPEYADGRPDPMNRWSERVIGAFAAREGGEASFPFGGPPWHPFLRWAAATGRAFESPVGLLVDGEAGLWTSMRGAVALPGERPVPEGVGSPCPPCPKPCLTACPVDALNAGGYDVPRCLDYVRSPEGSDCRTRGCAVRHACPVSQQWHRPDAQAAFHMRAFAGEAS